jgi:hypothetical protein
MNYGQSRITRYGENLTVQKKNCLPPQRKISKLSEEVIQTEDNFRNNKK